MIIVKRIAGAVALGAALLLGAGLRAPPVQAAFVETLTQQGSNVVATGNGTIDLAGLSYSVSGSASAEMSPGLGIIFTGPASSVDLYRGSTGPTNFGYGGDTFASSGSGDLVGIDGLIDDLFRPSGYLSGTPLSDTSTYDNQTFASLGVTPGTYTWSWGSGASDDTFTLDIETVPEPSSLALLALPLGLVLLLAVRRRHCPRIAVWYGCGKDAPRSRCPGGVRSREVKAPGH